MVRTFTAHAEKIGLAPVSQVVTMSEGETFRREFERLGFKVKVHAPACPLASGFKCYEGCAAACRMREDDKSVTYSCGATIRAA